MNKPRFSKIALIKKSHLLEFIPSCVFISAKTRQLTAREYISFLEMVKLLWA